MFLFSLCHNIKLSSLTLLCRRRITARECLAHAWMSDVTFTQPIRSHYESSTSVDSSISLSMDNMVSSAETSPISSATSSFAAGQSSFDANYSMPLDECMAVGDGKDSGIGHRASPLQLGSSLAQGLSNALISSVQWDTLSDDTRPQSRGNSSDWLGQRPEVSPSPSLSWAERSGRTTSMGSSASGIACDETTPVKRVAVSSLQSSHASTPPVEVGEVPPNDHRGKSSTEVESVRQPQLYATAQLPSDESTRRKKEVSPEVNKADEVMRLLRDGLSLTNGGSGSSSPNLVSTSSCVSIEHRRLYTDSGRRSITASRSAPLTSPLPGLSPARQVTSTRSSSAGAHQGMSEVMQLLTVGVPLTEGEEGSETEPALWATRGDSRRGDKLADRGISSPLRVNSTPEPSQLHQKGVSSETVSQRPGASPQRRRTSKPRPDSFIIPVEVQEAILKGDLDLAAIEEATERHPSPETKHRRAAWN